MGKAMLLELQNPCASTFVVASIKVLIHRLSLLPLQPIQRLHCWGGETIHSVAQLRSRFSNVSVNGIDVKITWITANMIIIDEISMLSLPDFMKLDKHLRKLMREVGGNEALPFGGLHIILCGDFFQLNPIMSIPIYNRRDNALWNLITQVIF